jgi:hypothetical protein
VPANDSGNYAIYPNQQLEPDLIERATVNLGTTDVDSPTAAAAGGTINYVTRRAAEEFGVRAEVGVGSNNFRRYYGTLETGRIGPFGTKAWISGSTPPTTSSSRTTRRARLRARSRSGRSTPASTRNSATSARPA